MSTILVIWTVVAAAPYIKHYDWRPLGEFASPEACQRAMSQLGLKTDTARCIAKA